MKPRVGLVVPAIELGGGVPSVAEFVCQTLERSGSFDVVVLSLSTAARDTLGVALTRPSTWLRGVRTSPELWGGRPVIRVGAFASEFEFQRFKPRSALTKLIRDVDLIHVVCGSPAWALSVCRVGKPVAIHCATRAVLERRRRDALAGGLLAGWRRLMTRITDRLDREALAAADAVLLMNPWMLTYAREVNITRAIPVVSAPPGVDTNRFRPRSERDLESHPYVLCVGRLDDPRKNIELLLRAFAAVRAQSKRRIRLVLAGLAGPAASFWTQAKQLGEDIEFVPTPDCRKLVRLYQDAAVFALSSDEEGFGMVILEAMACGIPVVSTRSGGPDGIITDGEDGYLVNLDDAATFADRIGRLLSDPLDNRRMGEAARRTMVERYDTDIAGRRVLDVYDELLRRGRPHS